MSATDFLRSYGPWALILGGSEGVGEGFARLLAAQGFNLVLAARREEPLAKLAASLRAEHPVEVRTVSVDLGKADALDHVLPVTKGLEVGLLICNAGANLGRGDFVTRPMEILQPVIGMNVLTQVSFSHHYVPAMVERGRGGVILVGSLAGYVGMAGLAVYSGAKAFSRIFAEALWYELRPHGVHVLHMPLPLVATPAVVRLGYDISQAADSVDMAAEGLAQIANGPVHDAGGPASAEAARLHGYTLPRSVAIEAAAAPAPKK
jgi:short-subunit dehydrogenase